MRSHLYLKHALVLFLFFLLPQVPAEAWHPRLTADSILEELGPAPIIGRDRTYILGPGENLIDLARRVGVGYEAMVRSNPGVDPWIPKQGEEVLLPFAAILPFGTGPGITINLAEYKLFLIWEEDGRRRVRIYPIGIGSEGWNTPEGTFKVICRVENPTWTVPESIRRDRPDMPKSVPPGPDNPLGSNWIGLSAPGVGIHGTHKPLGIGRRVSHGCIRLYPDDIRDLSLHAPPGTPVRIIYQPVKLGIRNEALYVEAHPDHLNRYPDLEKEVEFHVRALGIKANVPKDKLRSILEQARGIPQVVSHLPKGGTPGFPEVATTPEKPGE